MPAHAGQLSLGLVARGGAAAGARGPKSGGRVGQNWAVAELVERGSPRRSIRRLARRLVLLYVEGRRRSRTPEGGTHARPQAERVTTGTEDATVIGHGARTPARG